MSDQPYHFGFSNETQELILWKRGRRTEVCRIPLDNAMSLIGTALHVLNVEQDTNLLVASEADLDQRGS